MREEGLVMREFDEVDEGLVRTKSRLRVWRLTSSGDYRVVRRSLVVRKAVVRGIHYSRQWVLEPLDKKHGPQRPSKRDGSGAAG